MNGAKWIWLKGEFEIYHSLLLHARREELEADYAPMWSLPTPYPCVEFKKKFFAEKDGIFRLFHIGKGYVRMDGNKVQPSDREIAVSAGEHTVSIKLICTDGSFPAIFIDSDVLKTDETWTACYANGKNLPVGAMDEFADKDANPGVFPFRYEEIHPCSAEETEGGILYDFGKETFARIFLNGANPAETYRLIYGESKEEALSETDAIIRLKISGEADYRLDGRAFRYLFIKGNGPLPSLRAEYEYLPLPDRGGFECDNPEIQKIRDVCAYTFRLNSREFFLDGIKRDRWVWSGDAYQSYMANNYIYFDNEITKRTILALLGKPPYEQHVNTINDYTLYVILSVAEYYENTGDTDFVLFVWERIRLLYAFLEERLDEEGYVCQRKGDWIFIDWSPMDKDGPVCAEQILLWKTKKAMAFLAELAGEKGDGFLAEAEAPKEKILRDFWKEEKGAFIDCARSGKKNVTRHANIFAILYDFVGDDKKKKIFENVLENDAITPITTPYFEFFELLVYGKMGKIRHIQDKIESYWGGILNLGGTSIWEQFDPTKSGTEHYEMYGKKFGCSLCHAWGSGPIYLLGRFCLGVYPTDVGYRTFRVEPNPGKYKSFRGKVPLPEGEVSVEFDGEKITVTAGAEGGTLRWNGKEYSLKKDVPMTV